MNNSNAAAKRRRAGIQPTTPPMPPQNQPQSNVGMGSGQQQAPPGGYTLPQVIALIDTRLITLEKFMKETKESTDLSIPNYTRDQVVPVAGEEGDGSGAVFMDSKEFTDFVDDINQRFQLFADEINGLKEIVLKLQGFTMDVNKMLLASLSKNGEAVPNITFDVDESASETEPAKMELAEQTFVLESSSSSSSDGVESAVEKAVASSGKNKKR